MSERIYAWLLKLYPSHFREDCGAAVMQLFRDRLRAESGFLRRFRFWLDIITDLAVSIPREHRRETHAEPDPAGYRVSEEVVAALAKRSIIAPTVFRSLLVLLGFATGWLGNSEHTLLLAAYSILAFRTIGRFLAIERFKEGWRGYQLILGVDRLQERWRSREVTVLTRDIVKVNEDQHGLVIICLAQPGPPATIWIPAGLTGYQEMRQQLLAWIPGERFMQRRSLWFSNPGAARGAIWALLPAILLVHSGRWFLGVALVYYLMVLGEILLNVARPPRNSGLERPTRGLNLPPAAYMWRRLKNHLRRQPQLIGLIVLPILRAWIVTPR